MTDKQGATGGAAPPEMTPEQGEQLRAALIQQIAQQALQLLAFVGVHVENPDAVLQIAATQFEAQQPLLQEMAKSFMNDAAQKYPAFFVSFTPLNVPESSRLIVPGQPPPKTAYYVGGPKRLQQDDYPANIASSLAGLSYLLNPAMRVAAYVLGVRIDFGQANPQQQPPPIKNGGHFRGKAKV